MTESQQLLAEYVQNGSEAAFRELVTRYIDLVHSTALRLVDGDMHSAEDVTQTVFLRLSQNACKLSKETLLGGWLHRDTCYVANKTLRGERRRQAREREAALMNSLRDHSEAGLDKIRPILDEAINLLGNEDRTAVLLRFFEQRDFRSVGVVLGCNEDAARMRITRALEKLHSLLVRRGITLPVAALGTGLAAEAVTGAPAGLAANVAGTVLASSAASSGMAATLLKTMATAKLKTGIISAIVVASVLTPLALERQVQAKVRARDEALRQQRDRFAKLQAENERISNLLSARRNFPALSDEESRELLRLRNEIAGLRRDVQEAAQPRTATVSLSRHEMLSALAQRYSERASQLKQFLQAHPSENIPESQFVTESDWLWLAGQDVPDTEDGYRRVMSMVRQMAESNVGREIIRPALQQFARENNGQFPGDLSQLTMYFKTPLDDSILQRWQILHATKLVNLREDLRDEDWVITQKAPVNRALDQRFVFSVKDAHLFADAPPNHWDTAP